MTPTGIVARARRSRRIRLRQAAIYVLACGLAAGSGALALGVPGAGAATEGTWTATEAPLPGPAVADPSVGVRQVTCAAAGSCVGVASFTDASRNRAGLIEQLRRGTWTATRAPVPDGTEAGAQVVLTSVSCPARKSCGISGYLDLSAARRPEVLTLSRGQWAAQAAPLVPGTEPQSSTSLSSISCPRPGRCVAVGRYQDAEGHFQGLIEVQSGRRWRAEQAPLPADAGPDPVGGLEWVSCPAAGKCTSVGAYVDRQGNRQLAIDVLRHRRWRSSTAPLPADAAGDPVAYLGYVTCRDTRDCLAVGNYVTALGATEGLFERQVRGVWHATTAPVPANADPEDPRAMINEVSCPTARFCAATGAYRDAIGSFGASLETLSGGTWTAVAAPARAGDDSGRYMASVSCPKAGWCVAGGSTDFTGMLETYADGHWTLTVAPLPAPGTHAVFRSTSVSCPAVSRCAAFGGFTKHDGTRVSGQGLLETLTAGPHRWAGRS